MEVSSSFKTAVKCFEFSLEKYTKNINGVVNVKFQVKVLLKPLTANPTKWSNILKQFVDNSRQIV